MTDYPPTRTDPTGKGWSGPPLLAAEYDLVTCAVLRAEIAYRNAGREDDDQISTTGRKADLTERLRSDDATTDACVEANWTDATAGNLDESPEAYSQPYPHDHGPSGLCLFGTRCGR